MKRLISAVAVAAGVMNLVGVAGVISVAHADNFLPNETIAVDAPLPMPKTPQPVIDDITAPASLSAPSAGAPASASVPVPPRVTPSAVAPASVAATAPAANDAVLSVHSVEYWVQMGAFSSPLSATTLETQLKARGLNARVFVAELHRVAVGPYHTKEQATRSLESLKAIEKEAFLTTQNRLFQ